MQVISKYLNYRIVKYGFIGGVATIIHIAAAYTYLYIISDSIFASNIIGFLFAFAFSYTFQSKFVFNHSISYEKAIKYFVVQFASLLIAVTISNYAPLQNSYLKVILVIILLPIITYLTHKFWTFSDPNIRKS